MKKNIKKLLFLISVLSIGNILNAYNDNSNSGSEVKKPPIEIRIDNGQGRTNDRETVAIQQQEKAGLKQSAIPLVQ